MRTFKILAICYSITVFGHTMAQTDVELQKLNTSVKKASTPSQKVDAYFGLSEYYFMNNPTASDSLAFLGMAAAESSRDRVLIVNACLKDATRFLQNTGAKENIKRALVKAEKALVLSRQSEDPDLQVMCYNLLGDIYRRAGESDKALKANNAAIALLPDVKNDSIKISAYAMFGGTLRAKSDMLNAFKAYLNALNLAEQSNKPSQIIFCNRSLEEFYIDIEDFEKAKDYAFKSLYMDEKRNDRSAVMEDYFGIASIYTSAKDIAMAKFYYDKTEKLADSLHSKDFKIYAKLGMLNMYLNSKHFKEGYAILKDSPLIFDFLRKSGMQYEMDKGNGYIQMMLGHYDSSFYYYKKAEPFFATSATPYKSYYFYSLYSLLYKTLKQWDKAIYYQNKCREAMEHTGDLETLDLIIQNLDSLSYYKGDYKSAYNYQVLHQHYSDSLRKMSEQKDILSLEIDNENKRAERAKVVAAQEENKRHNLQYMGITAAICGVFILLITLGLFKVSTSVVKAIGFFAFIFLFEFIILILDNQIHHFTHGEPWKVLLIKILLIAMLLPLHHWLEEKVIHFLIENRMLLTTKFDQFKLKRKGISEL